MHQFPHVQAKAAVESGDTTAAAENWKLAQKWTARGLLCGSVVLVFVFMLLFLAIALGIYFGVYRQRRAGLWN